MRALLSLILSAGNGRESTVLLAGDGGGGGVGVVVGEL